MGRHVEVHQIPERYKYHTYWTLHLPMILNTIKKIAQQNVNTNNTYIIGKIGKSSYEHVANVSLEYVCAKSITLCMLRRKLQAIM